MTNEERLAALAREFANRLDAEIDWLGTDCKEDVLPILRAFAAALQPDPNFLALKVAEAELAHTVEAKRVYYCPGGPANFAKWLEARITEGKRRVLELGLAKLEAGK